MLYSVCMKSKAGYEDVKSVIIDFDSVICACESMDLLFEELLQGESETSRLSVVAEVQRITRAGMEGEIGFAESLSSRLGLVPRRPFDLQAVVKRIEESLSATFVANYPNWDPSKISVISSGFRQLIGPPLTEIGMPPERIHCNSLVIDENGIIKGVQTDNPLCRDRGKVEVAEALSLPRKIVMVGDGYTDWQVAESGQADYFFGYVEHVRRESVMKRAAEILTDFDQLAELVDLT